MTMHSLRRSVSCTKTNVRDNYKRASQYSAGQALLYLLLANNMDVQQRGMGVRTYKDHARRNLAGQGEHRLGVLLALADPLGRDGANRDVQEVGARLHGHSLREQRLARARRPEEQDTCSRRETRLDIWNI